MGLDLYFSLPLPTLPRDLATYDMIGNNVEYIAGLSCSPHQLIIIIFFAVFYSLCADLSRTTSNADSRDVFQNRQPICLPPCLEDDSKLSSMSTTATTRMRLHKHKRKLPPIERKEKPKVGSNQKEETMFSDTVDTGDTDYLKHNDTLGSSSKPVRITKRPLRTSTFKDTPLCYQPFSRKITYKICNEAEEQPLEQSVTSLEDCSLPSREGDETPDDLENQTRFETDTPNSLLNSDIMANKVLNKVERYEKLVRVLTLFKQAKELEKKEGQALEEIGIQTGEITGQGIESVKEHIKAALDEAIKLRLEMDVENL